MQQTNPSQAGERTRTPFILCHKNHLPQHDEMERTMEAIVEYRQLERGAEPKRDRRGYIKGLQFFSVACRIGLSGLVAKYDVTGLDPKLAHDFAVALGGYGQPEGWRVLPALGAQGVYKSRHGWIAWRVGAASNPYVKLCGTISPKAALARLTIRK